MKVRLDYGSDGLEVELPDERCTIIEPNYPPGVADPAGVLRETLASPTGSSRLRELVRPGQRVAISVCDGTRPQPRELMLRAIFDELHHASIPRSDITILIATGTHRGNTGQELRSMLGHEIASELRVINHDARDRDSLRLAGKTASGLPVWLNRLWLDADVRITTGFVEPHFFAGFSGGPKMVAPGLAGLDTTMILHDATHVGHPDATWGITEGNPIHDDVREIAGMTGVTFALDVTLNGEKEVTAAFAGELFAEHALACRTSKHEAMRAVAAPFDVVVTTNSGFPLDQNLYQTIKGLSAAARVVKDGGVILCASECRDGLPEHGAYAELLRRRSSPAKLLAMVHEQGFREPDQWQVQVQAMIQSKARVRIRTDYLSPAELGEAHFEPLDDVAKEASRALEAAGPEARLCVLPRGPQTIPYLEPES
jgi:nickel-dependent lactate racemase